MAAKNAKERKTVIVLPALAFRASCKACSSLLTFKLVLYFRSVLKTQGIHTGTVMKLRLPEFFMSLVTTEVI